MNSNLLVRVKQRLFADYAFQEKANTTFLTKGKCPSCQKKELFISATDPWMMKCNRLNQCGVQIHIKEIYPDLFNNWSEDHPSDETNPTATADAYLTEGRGFNLAKIIGSYSQEFFFDKERNIGSATVRFKLAENVYWERIIDKPERFGSQKARFLGSFKGHWFKANQNLEKQKEIWIVEGIFDAIALMQVGITAVSNMNASHFAEYELKKLAKLKTPPKLIWAFDSDKAGREYSLQQIARCQQMGFECEAAQTPRGKDWNDLFQYNKLQKKDIAQYRYLGSLLTAKTAAQKGLLIYGKKGYNTFYFDFQNKLFWFEIDYEKYCKIYNEISEKEELEIEKLKKKALEQSNSICEISTCNPQAIYFQRNEVADEALYFFRVYLQNGRKINATFSGSQCSAATEFKKRLLSTCPGGVFTGSSSQLDRIMKEQLANIKTVEAIDFLGYSKEHSVYIFKNIAIQNGRVYPINQDDYFDLPKVAIKSVLSNSLSINTDKNDYNNDWFKHMHTAFKDEAIIAMAWWLGSLFAEQIRNKHKSFTFLEIVGEAGSGKTTLIEFMWKLMGRFEYEGFDPVKSTSASRARNLAQFGNMPCSLTEADREQNGQVNQRGFDWDELKTAYNGRCVRGRGIKNFGNDTFEPPFRGAILISQNNPVTSSEAILSRICHIGFKRSQHSMETKKAAQWLERINMDNVSYFLVDALKKEDKILELFHKMFTKYEAHLEKNDKIKMQRVCKNHAQLLALVECLQLVVGFDDEIKISTQKKIVEMAEERQICINAENPIVEEFFEAIDFIEDKAGSEVNHMLNHSKKIEIIAINLKEFESKLKYYGLNSVDSTELKKALKNSKKFLGIKTVNSRVNSKSKRCWCFKNQNYTNED